MSAYAVIQTGGKQYRVASGDTVVVEQLSGEVGDTVDFEEVLLVSNDGAVALGAPMVAGAKVTGEIIGHGLGEKLIIYKFHRRKDYRRKRGHRQRFTAVKIGNVVAPS